MTLRSYVLTLNGSIQQLSTLLAATVQDVPVYCIDLQCDAANANAVYVGASDVDANKGIRLPVPVSSVPEAPYRIGSFDEANVYMADVFVIGTNSQKLRVLVFA